MRANTLRTNSAWGLGTYAALSALSLSVLAACANDIQDPDGLPDGAIYGGNGTVLVPGGNGTYVPAGGKTGGGGTTGNPAGGGIIVAGGTTAMMPGSASPMNLQGEPIYSRFIRLTHEQWERAVQDILKLPAPSGLSAMFEQPVAGSTDFLNNEHLLSVSKDLWDQYRVAAETLAEKATESDAALARIYPGTDPAGFITTVGRRIYRRPLTPAEVQKYQTLYQTGTTLSGARSAFAKGAGLVLRAMLQSPYFLYRTELGPKGSPLDGYEMASKLSFLFRGTTPTDADLDAAEQGKLDTPDGVAALAAKMLEEPAAAEIMKQFHGEMLAFVQFASIDKVGVPEYSTALNADYEQSAYLFFDRIFKKGLGVRDILTSTVGFVSPKLAPLYGLSVSGSGFVERDLGPERPGFFSQLPYLTLHALNDEPDSILRGRDINLAMLCVTLGPPAAVPSVPALKPGQTNRERITELTAGCGGDCHNALLNPVGFAFENFDGLGRLRTMDNGKPVDTSGSYPFAEGTKTFANARELMQHMAEGVQAHACYSKKLASFMLQRDIIVSDVPLLEAMSRTSMTGSIKDLILDLVKHPAFRTRAQ